MSLLGVCGRQMVKTPTIGARGGVVGRPRKLPPMDAAIRIEKLAREGRGVVGVASQLGTTREVLRRWMGEDEALTAAFERGKEAERHELHTILLNGARDGEKPNINAMFLLKARHGYREGDTGDSVPSVNVQINLPGAMSPDQYKSAVTVEHEADHEGR